MSKIVKVASYWEIVVECGNDHGEPSYRETRKYETMMDCDDALENMNYYDIPISIREVVEYKIDYEEDENFA